MAIETIFWLGAFGLFYIYFGYPLLLGTCTIFRRRCSEVSEIHQPTVSLIIAAYNEEAMIGEKIENSLRLKYPKEKFEIIVFSDGSTDRTDEIVQSYANKGVKLLRIAGRKGKTFCQNEAVKAAKGEINVFSDADSMYEPDAIQNLVRHFADEHVGCVSGEFRYRSRRNEGQEVVEGERIYWRYDQILKRLESQVSSLVGGSGAIYAVRKELFEPLPPAALEDFVRPLRFVQKGYKVVYEPTAVSWGDTTQDPRKESWRRVRMVTQSVYSLLRDRTLLALLNPLQYGIFSVQLWSHKVLRWFSGLFLLLIFFCNIPLAKHSWVYSATMAGQVFFYLLALWGFIAEKALKRQPPKLPHIAYYFCLSCYAMLKGVYYGLRGRTIATWTPVR